MTEKEWLGAAALLASYYPTSFKLETTEAIAHWGLALAHLPAEKVQAAIIHMARTQPAFPSVADICRHAEDHGPGAAEAWEEVMRAVRSIGWCGKPEWSSPAIARGVTHLGGWQAICQSNADELPAMRAHFAKAYAEFKEAAAKEATFAQVIGPVHLELATEAAG